MDEQRLAALLGELIALTNETEWVEFKENRADETEIGEYISALSNSAALLGEKIAFMVWGVRDSDHELVGTSFRPSEARRGNENLDSWLSHQLQPRIHFKIHELDCEGKHFVVFEIPPALHTPVRFNGQEFIRIGSYKKNLRDYPEKERSLWAVLSRYTFETSVAASDLTADEALSVLDYPSYFDLTCQPLPSDKIALVDRLVRDKLIQRSLAGRFDVLNLGAILFARNLNNFDSLARKATRVVIYKGTNRVEAVREQGGHKGYGSGFEGLISYVNEQLPSNEEITRALRAEHRVYPEIAIRELIANAVVHQDFFMAGSGPMVEIFADRIEITNPGSPLVETLRFIDAPPQSRNDRLAAMMRRLGVVEERGSGIDKVIAYVEAFQLPAPDFTVVENHTRVVLYGPRKFAAMTRSDRTRACYQHASLQCVSGAQMTNASLRARFGISDSNYSMASRIISDTLETGLIKPYDTASRSRRDARYVPYWA